MHHAAASTHRLSAFTGGALTAGLDDERQSAPRTASVSERIDRLDITLFRSIGSLTTAGDRRSLLAIQRATATIRKRFSYLEIGSHLGGTIQPYLLDERCTRIYSVDLRPRDYANDGSKGHVEHFAGNSTARMLDRLRTLHAGQVSKVRCFDMDVSDVPATEIPDRPAIAFIDGQHTREAVLSDFARCRELLSEGGTIVFHDYGTIYPAVDEILGTLRQAGQAPVGVKLDDGVFAIFFDRAVLEDDPFLRACHARAQTVRFRGSMFLYRAMRALLRGLPRSWFVLLSRARNTTRTGRPALGDLA